MTNGGFEATHVAPADGLQAWDAPDPTRTPVAEVQPGVVMQLLERRGAWAHVVFSNGWMGWVDGRRMVDAAPAVPAPPAAAPAAERQQPRDAEPLPRPQPVIQPSIEPDNPFTSTEPAIREAELAMAGERTGQGTGDRTGDRTDPGPAKGRSLGSLTSNLGGAIGPVKISAAPIGALVVFLGSLLPWIRMSGFRGNAFRVPIAFLVDYKTQGGGLKVGLLLVAAAVVSGVFCVLPGRVQIRRIVGGIVIAVAVLYTIELERVLSSAGKLAPSLTSVVGIGVLVVVAGGVALIVDKTEPAPR